MPVLRRVVPHWRPRVAKERVGLAVVAFVGFTVVFGGMAMADDPTGAWTDPAPQTASGDSVPIGYLAKAQKLSGIADHSAGIDNVSFALVEDAATSPSDPCSAWQTAPSAVLPFGGANHAAFSFDATFPCNRRYLVRATVNPRRPLTHGPSNPLRLDIRVVVAIPPADVGYLTAEAIDDTQPAVRLNWAMVSPRPPDFEGYQIRRADGTGQAGPIADVVAGQSSFLDEAVTPGAAYRYEVVAARSGPEPGTVVYSAAPAAVEVTVPGPSTPTAVAAGDRNGTGETSTRPRRSPTPGAGSASAKVPSTTDAGYRELLPFRVPPTTGLPSEGSVIARLEGDEGSPDRQALGLLAAGLVTLVGAGLLRFVVAAAKD